MRDDFYDSVFNYTGCDFFAFKDLRENQQDSPYKDWYIVSLRSVGMTTRVFFVARCEALPEADCLAMLDAAAPPL